MIFSKRSHEGYLMIDHRNSPGVTPDIARARDPAAPVAGKNQMLESATITCSHCQRVVILNPDRSRDRHYCGKCDHYICDNCATSFALTGVCVPFRQLLDERDINAIFALGKEYAPAPKPLLVSTETQSKG